MPEEPPIWPGQVGGSKSSQALAKAKQDFTNLYPTRVLPRKGASRKGRVVWRNDRSTVEGLNATRTGRGRKNGNCDRSFCFAR
jgi:hypothetical protein